MHHCVALQEQQALSAVSDVVQEPTLQNRRVKFNPNEAISADEYVDMRDLIPIKLIWLRFYSASANVFFFGGGGYRR